MTMKGQGIINIVVLLSFSLTCGLLWSCKNDDPGDPVPFAELMAFDVQENYFFPLFPGDTFETRYFLTDRKGRILVDTVLVNGKVTRLMASFDPDDTYDLTVVHRTEYFGVPTYGIGTYLNVKPHTYTLSRLSTTSEDMEYVITQISNPLVDFSNSIDSIQSQWFGDHAVLRLTKRSNPGTVYASFRQESDLHPRYLFREHITSDRDTIAYTDLPSISNTTECSFPPNTGLETTIYGLKDDLPDVLFKVDQFDVTTGSSHATYHLPDSIFDRYKFYTGWYNNGNLYSANKIVESIPSEVSQPDLSFTIQNSDPDNFHFTSPSSYDHFWMYFNYGSQSTGFQVLWGVYGEGGADNHFEIPYFPIMFPPGLPFTANDLNFQYGRIVKMEGLGDYHGQLQYYLGLLAVPEEQITNFEALRHQ